MFEKIPSVNEKPLKTPAEIFKSYSEHPEQKELEREAYERLESALSGGGMEVATASEVSDVLNSADLLCRSENFSKVLDLIEFGDPIQINNSSERANMCNVAAGSGFRVAMLEGFSGKDVGSFVKVVVTFKGEHIERSQIPKEDELWLTKPDTAAVSMAGTGEISKDDIEMVSFRFPVNHFPEYLLSEEESEALDEELIKFIVRHYIKKDRN